MIIKAKTIPHEKQHYDTVGDYWKDKKGVIQIRVSKDKREEYEWLVLIHELVEICLIKFQGVSMKEVDKFDLMVEKRRGHHVEPGDEMDAPYYKQHHLVTVVERLVCHELGLNWEEYNSYS